MRSSNGGKHGLAGWGFRGLPEAGAGLWADNGANSLSHAGSPVFAANLRLAELRSVSEFSGAEGFSLVLAAKARRTAVRRHRRALQADQACRTARRRWRVPAALIGKEGQRRSSRVPTELSPELNAGLTFAYPLRTVICATLSASNGRENVDGQAEADLAGRDPHRRAEEIAGAQNRRQIHGAEIDQGKRSQDQGAPAASRQARSSEAAHRHQPLSRRGFQSRWLARLRALSGSRHRGGH